MLKNVDIFLVDKELSNRSNLVNFVRVDLVLASYRTFSVDVEVGNFVAETSLT